MAEALEETAINLNNLPNEILLQIFSNLNDTSMLRANRVCKLWKCLIKKSFAKKYNGSTEEKYYTLKISSENFVEERKQYFPVFRNFGENIGALSITFVEKNTKIVPESHWLISLIQSFCYAITKVKIANGSKVDLANIIGFMPNISHLSLVNVSMLNNKWTELTFHLLTHFSASRLQELENEHLAVFFNLNRHIQDASLLHCVKVTNDIIYSINDEHKQLRSLMLRNNTGFNNLKNLKIESLTSFCVRVTDVSFKPVLSAIQNGCKSVEDLSVCSDTYYMDLDINHINLLCSFKFLKTLQLEYFSLPLKLLKVLVRQLPNLISLSTTDAKKICETHDNLMSVVAACQQLSFLKLVVDPFLPKLNYNFYTRFVDVLESAASNLKLEICDDDSSYKMVLTREEFRFFEEYNQETVLYWKGYDATHNSSKINLLELNENILIKFMHFLDGNDLYAFYRTCKQAQRLVKEHLSHVLLYSSLEQSFFPTELIIDESVFRSLGEYIYRMEVDLDDTWADEDEAKADHQQKATKHFDAINKYCKSLIELEINGQVESESELFWPQLKKLHFHEVNSRMLRLFRCPKLTELEINSYDNSDNVHVETGDVFPNLTILKFGCYDEHVEKFLYSLNETICGQLKELSFEGYRKQWFNENQHLRCVTLCNIITRFQNLVTLCLLIPGTEPLNFKFLFENCSKLTEMSIDFTCDYRRPYLKALKQVKVNCKQIKIIKLVGSCSCSSVMDEIYSLFRNTQTKVEVIHSRS